MAQTLASRHEQQIARIFAGQNFTECSGASTVNLSVSTYVTIACSEDSVSNKHVILRYTLPLQQIQKDVATSSSVSSSRGRLQRYHIIPAFQIDSHNPSHTELFTPKSGWKMHIVFLV